MFTDEETAKLVATIRKRHAAGHGTVEQLVQEYGISVASYYRWSRLYGAECQPKNRQSRILGSANLKVAQQLPTPRIPPHPPDVVPQLVSFRPVEVKAEIPYAQESNCTVISPGGWRIEGLTVQGVAQLMPLLASSVVGLDRRIC